MLFRILNNDSERSLKVVILTQHRGPGNLPAIYVTPEEPGKIRGYVEFQSTEDIKGEDLDLNFRVKSEAKWYRHYGNSTVAYHSKQVLQRKSWRIPVSHSRPGVVSSGTTRFDFVAELEPQTPSSIKGRRSWLNYRFTATLRRRFPRRNIVFKQDRTILVDIPPAPRLSCTTHTRPVQKTHVMKLIMQVKTATMTDREARELRIEMGVKVTGPRPPTDALLEEPPPYSAVWDGVHDGDDSD
ncbi:hypothetical protein BGX34_008046 [Mortierella sp. NVP85]|nr:hypothetical protein BGX34_008046 [Mortierella sp. NVP85]